MNSWFKMVLVSAFLLLSLSVLSPCIFATSEDQISLLLDDTDESVASTFEAVKEAETNGAEISGFSGLLQDATQLLAQAHNSFYVGDFDKAEKFANLALEIVNEVKSEAISLGEIKSNLPLKEMWDTVIGSAISVFVIVIMSFLSWILFKRLYNRKQSAKKPEVASVEY